MSGKLTILLLLAILGFTTASVKITGTPEKVKVAWVPNKEETFEKITIFKQDNKIVEFIASLGKLKTPTGVDCAVNKDNTGVCEITVSDVTETTVNHEYKATVKWSDKEEATNEAGHVVCVIGNATKPKIERLNDVLLNCSSDGIPAPVLSWTDINGTNISENKSSSFWDPKTKRYHSWSTCNTTSDKTYISINCNAQQKKKDSCKYEVSNSFTNFGKATKPNIVKITKTILNCTSNGLPAPKLTWINGTNTATVPEIASSSAWDSGTKTYSVWSTYNMTNIKTNITCVAEQVTEGKRVNLASDGFVNSAGKIGGPSALVAALIAVAFFTMPYRL